MRTKFIDTLWPAKKRADILQMVLSNFNFVTENIIYFDSNFTDVYFGRSTEQFLDNEPMVTILYGDMTIQGHNKSKLAISFVQVTKFRNRYQDIIQIM